METEHIFKLIDERKDELFELLSSFVKINTENFWSYGNEEALAVHIHKLCIELGLESDLYSPLDIEGFENHPDYMQGRGLENRYNVTARWRGEEDIDELMLMGHSDTVEIGSLDAWEKPALSGEISDGKIFGRGAGDDKYALATSIFVIKLLKEIGFKPKKNLLFTAYSDEEHGGSHGALAAVLKYPAPRILNMDGGEDQVKHCGSGGGEVYYNYHVNNTVDSAKTAALALNVVIGEIDKFAEKRRTELEGNRFYKGTIIPSTSLRYMNVQAGDNGVDLDKGSILFTYYTDKTKAEIEEEFRELEKSIAEKLLPFGIIGDGFTHKTRFFHYVFTEPDSEDIKILLEASREVSGQEPLVCGSCLSDLSVISKYGSSRAFAFGMGRDFSMPGGAHQPNEFIYCDKFVEYTKTIAAYVIKILG